MKVVMLHGINHNMFGKRDPKQYGTITLDQINDKMQSIAEQIAKNNGCAGIEFVGRPGWKQTARQYGYAVQSVTYQKFFEEATS